MNIFLKSKGMGFHISRFLCIVLTISMVLIGFPIEIVFAKEKGGNNRIDYIHSIETIEYNSPESQGRTQSISLIKLLRNIQGGIASYELDMEGVMRVGYREEIAGFKHGPVTISRNLSTQKVTTDYNGLKLPVTIINNTISQVAKGSRRAGTWKENIAFDISEYLPQTLALNFSVQPVDIGGAPDTLLIAVTSEPFTFLAADIGNITVSSHYKAILIYSPSENRLYQSAMVFTADYGNQKVRIENLKFLSDAKGEKALFHFVDPRRYLGMEKQGIKIKKEGAPPLRLLQIIKAYEMVDVSGMTAAERATNILPVVILGGVLLSDSALAVWSQVAVELGYQSAQPYTKGLIKKGYQDIGRAIGGPKGEGLGGLFADIFQIATLPVGWAKDMPGTFSLPFIGRYIRAAQLATISSYVDDLLSIGNFVITSYIAIADEVAAKAEAKKKEIKKFIEEPAYADTPAPTPAKHAPGEKAPAPKAGSNMGPVIAGALAVVAIGAAAAGGLGEDEKDSGSSCRSYSDLCSSGVRGVRVVLNCTPKSCSCPSGTTDISSTYTSGQACGVSNWRVCKCKY